MGWSLFDTLLFRCMLLLSFHTFLRPGEAADSSNSLQFSNITFKNNCVVVKFTSFKHHFGLPISIFVKPTFDLLYPVASTRTYICIRGSFPGNLFCLANGQPISYTKYSKMFYSLISSCGISSNLSLHSIRMGAATHAALLGNPEPDIRRTGHWKSES